MSCAFGHPVRSRIVVLVVVLAAVTALGPARSRAQDDVWYVGYGGVIRFESGTVSSGGTHPMFAIENVVSQYSRSTRRMLFCSNGPTVWNSAGDTMSGGADIGGDVSSSRGALAVPLPGSDSIFYLFVTDAAEHLTPFRSPDYSGFQYATIDLRANGGAGAVTQSHVRLPPADVVEGIGGTMRCRDGTYWIVVHEVGSSRFYTYHLTAAGITGTVVSETGPPVGTLLHDVEAQIVFRPDGRLFALPQRYNDKCRLYSFDPETGVVKYASVISASVAFDENACFSPNGRYLYLESFASVDLFQPQLFQYDVTSRDSTTIDASIRAVPIDVTGTDTVPERVRLTQMQIGVDGRIYISSPSERLLVIDSCDFRPPQCSVRLALVFDWHRIELGLPNLILTDRDLVRVHAGRDTVICSGDSTTLHVAGGAISAWIPDSTLSCLSCRDPVASPTESTTYRVVVANAAGCTTMDSVRVTVLASPEIDLVDTVNICDGDSASVVARGADEYSWYPADELSCTECHAPTAFPRTTTTFYVTGTLANGCSTTDSVVVVVAPIPEVEAGGDVSICRGTGSVLTASGSGVPAWSPSAGLSCVNCLTPVASPDSTTTYVVSMTSPSGCVARDSVRVTVLEPPQISVSNDADVCAGDSLQLFAGGGVSYRWEPRSTLSCSECAEPMAFPDTTTTYVVTVADSAGCVASDSVTVSVDRRPMLTIVGDTVLCRGQSGELLASGATRYAWDPAPGLSCTDCATPRIRPTVSST